MNESRMKYLYSVWPMAGLNHKEYYAKSK